MAALAELPVGGMSNQRHVMFLHPSKVYHPTKTLWFRQGVALAECGAKLQRPGITSLVETTEAAAKKLGKRRCKNCPW